MERERKLYNKFVDILLEKLDSGDISPKELEIVLKFLDNNNIQASPTTHQGLNDLTSKVMSLPFDNERELPVKRVK